MWRGFVFFILIFKNRERVPEVVKQSVKKYFLNINNAKSIESKIEMTSLSLTYI